MKPNHPIDIDALHRGLCSRRSIDGEGVSDNKSFDGLLAVYLTAYAPQTVPEHEAIVSIVETQWQLTRVRRLIDLAFLRGGELLATAKMIDSFSRHQTRVHRILLDLNKRLDDLMNQRDPDDGDSGQSDSGFVSQNPGKPGPPKSGFVSHRPETTPPASSGFVSQNLHPSVAEDSGFVLEEPGSEDSGFVSQDPVKAHPTDSGFASRNNAPTDPGFASKGPLAPAPTDSGFVSQMPGRLIHTRLASFRKSP